MTQYTIALPDGTTVKGEDPKVVQELAKEMRDGYEDEDQDDSKTLQERVYKAFASNEEFPHWSIKQPPGTQASSDFYIEVYDPDRDECGCVVCELREAKENLQDVQDRL